MGDHAVEGIYYQRWGTGAHNYVYLSNLNPTFIHSHLGRAVKFPMIPLDHRVKGGNPIYKVFDEHHRLISRSIL
jgi:hypothetical protein